MFYYQCYAKYAMELLVVRGWLRVWMLSACDDHRNVSRISRKPRIFRNAWFLWWVGIAVGKVWGLVNIGDQFCGLSLLGALLSRPLGM
jgi:hypothetical protein